MRWSEAGQGPEPSVPIFLNLRLRQITEVEKLLAESFPLTAKSTEVSYGLAASSASFLIVNSSLSTSVSIEEPSVPYWGSLETSPMNSRICLSSSIAPSPLVKVMALPQAGQESEVTVLALVPLDPVGRAKKFPSRTCPNEHSHRLNDVSSSTYNDDPELPGPS